MLKRTLSLALYLAVAGLGAYSQTDTTEHETFQERTCRPIPATPEVTGAIDVDTGIIPNGPAALRLIGALLNQGTYSLPCGGPASRLPVKKLSGPAAKRGD